MAAAGGSVSRSCRLVLKGRLVVGLPFVAGVLQHMRRSHTQAEGLVLMQQACALLLVSP
jgi:hypothetical protein